MDQKISTDIQGLDEILQGGLIPDQSYLVKGGPGTGKSTLGYHFLQEGLGQGEQVLYISLGEPKPNILNNAKKLNIDLSGANFLDLSPTGDPTNNTLNYDVFPTSEVEHKPIVQSIIDAFKEHQPTRVVLDSITILSFLNKDPFQFRNFGLSFINYVCNNGATLMIISESADEVQTDPTFWVDGIINVSYAPEWRKIKVTKYRGTDFMHGTHSFRITGEGVKVFPRLHPDNYKHHFTDEILSSGIDEIDQLLGGGIEKGTTTLVTGPSGVGKTNLGLQFFKEAASRNHRSAIYTFEESKELISKRSENINIPIQNMLKNGNLKICPVEPLSYSPDEFAQMVRQDVENNDTRMVMIDSIGGYGLAVREENKLERLHSLVVYLQNMGVTTFLINESQSVTGDFVPTNMNASYLADNIIFLRYLELDGELQKSIGVLKKRLSDFEKTIRKFTISSDGISVGEPFHGLRGLLTGLPESAN
ncbi:MAG: ATPase domain-containing protein [Balneolaceae bacterium]|nr:ATPase domain-containing protein [Balneolaceae bacterium]